MKAFLLIMTALCGLFPAAAWSFGEGPSAAQIHQAEAKAQQAIDACWAISKDDRDSGVTLRMRSGTFDTAMCIENHIVHLSETVLFPGDPDAQRDVKIALEHVRYGTGQLYWHLHNSHAECRETPCGTINHLFNNAEIAKRMEIILKDFYLKIAEYDRYDGALR